MKRLILTGLASLVLACSSEETKCSELGVALERTRTEMENARPKYCHTIVMMGMYDGFYQCGGNKGLFETLKEKYNQLKENHYEDCNQVPVNID